MSQSGSTQWEDLFSQHQIILTKHLDMLSMMQKNSGDSIVTSAILQACLEQTESMKRTFKESTEAFQSNRSQENGTDHQNHHHSSTAIPEHTIPRAKSSSSIPITDPSGLFSIDSNPTPLEELLAAKAKITSSNGNPKVNGIGKRKISDGNYPPQEFNYIQVEQEQDRKRPRMQDDNTDPIGTTISIDDDDSFAREVEAKHKAKEDKRKNMNNKKRKRESGDSLPSETNYSNRPSNKPKPKKLKKTPQTKSQERKHHGGRFRLGNSKKSTTGDGGTNGASYIGFGQNKKRRR